MIIKPNVEYRIASVLLFLINAAVSALFFHIDNNIFIALTIFAFLLILNIRFFVALCKTIVFDKDGITVSVLFYKRSYDWDDLKTKRSVDHTNSRGYKDDALKGAEFSPIEIKNTHKLKSASYCVLCRPLTFIFVYFPPKRKLKYTANYPMPYSADEESFSEMLARFGIELDR